MGKKPHQSVQPQVFTAKLGANGEVINGNPISVAAAVAERQAGRDVVVCGPRLVANIQLGQHRVAKYGS